MLKICVSSHFLLVKDKNCFVNLLHLIIIISHNWFTLLITFLFAWSVFSCSLWLAFEVLMNMFLILILFLKPLVTGWSVRMLCNCGRMDKCAQLNSPQHLHLLFLHHRNRAWFLCSPALSLIYLSLNWKHGAEFTSGVSRPCYPCNTSYMW